jgi:hypothetical protein
MSRRRAHERGGTAAPIESETQVRVTISHRLADDELAQVTPAETCAALGQFDTPALFGKPYNVDVDHDVPNGGGSSIDRKTHYIDRVLYQQCMDGEFKATGLEPQQIVDRWLDHEHAEICILAGDNPVDTYYPAHERALCLEHEGVLAILGRKDGAAKIRRYEETIWPALLACYHRPIKNPPPDLWCGPNLDDPGERDEEILAQLAKLGVDDAHKRSKYSVHYGMAKHRCRACRFWSPSYLSQEQGQIAACEAVSGTVRQDRGCDLWQKVANEN